MEGFDNWNLRKQRMAKRKLNLRFFEREVWLVSVGQNIGVEINGKGINFLRPVLVYKKFSYFQSLVVPLSASESSYFCYRLPLITFLKKQSFLRFSQVRVVDSKRFIKKLGKVTPNQFELIKKSAREFLEPQ